MLLTMSLLRKKANVQLNRRKLSTVSVNVHCQLDVMVTMVKTELMVVKGHQVDPARVELMDIPVKGDGRDSWDRRAKRDLLVPKEKMDPRENLVVWQHMVDMVFVDKKGNKVKWALRALGDLKASRVMTV